MASLSVQQLVPSGLALTPVAASAGGDTFANNGLTILRVSNSHSSAQTVTATAIYECSQNFIHTEAVSVPAGMVRYLGPFPVSRFGDPVSLTYSGVTSLTVGPMTL